MAKVDVDQLIRDSLPLGRIVEREGAQAPSRFVQVSVAYYEGHRVLAAVDTNGRIWCKGGGSKTSPWVREG